MTAERPSAKRADESLPTDVPAAVDSSERFDPWPDDVEVHIEWEAHGAALAAERGDLVVIVDVLSFSTSVTIAISQGATVLSYSEAEIAANGGRDRLCADVEAAIVSKKRTVTDGYSLSPASLATIGPGERLIFTSLNGALCTAAAGPAPLVLIGCLLNRSAVAEWISRHWLGSSVDGGEEGERRPRRCTLIACGERWTSTADADGWRPGIEDHLGVGAIASALSAAGHVLSVEAVVAARVFESAEGALAATLGASISGRELITRGFPDDVRLAASLDSVAEVAAWNTDDAVRQFTDISGSDISGSDTSGSGD